SPTDQAIGTGDGTARVFQLAKAYGSGGIVYMRTIRKPVAGTVRVAVGGVERMEAEFTVDATTGAVSFVAAPVAGAEITAGFEFDVPVRFDTDFLEINLAAFEAGSLPSVPVIEVRV
ncbi:DUF2460 domain-containing protein, partial [Parvibaculum sp.]|uniref:DUF2460 domain-containing protein n=1 Tax=Parvibaculum sp. TaxID=2024848 RepID=UPI002D0986DC